MWYLAPFPAAGTKRTCTVPTGKSLAFPHGRIQVSWNFFDGEATVHALRSRNSLTFNTRLVSALAPVNIDGFVVEDLGQFRAQSPNGGFQLQPSPIFDNSVPQTAITSPQLAVAMSYFIWLKPLSPGWHVLNFATGTYCICSGNVCLDPNPCAA